MSESELEGSLILEKLAEAGLVDKFYDAVDTDNFNIISEILQDISIDSKTIKLLLKKITNSDGFEFKG